MEKRNVNTFVFWGIICLLANILCTFADGYDGDQSFWVGWTQQLVDGGFGNFKGNYPPVYVFWLWIVAHIHDLFGIGIGKTFFMKFMCLWPVYFSHVFLLDWLCRFMDRFHYPEWKRHALAGFVALNPALLRRFLAMASPSRSKSVAMKTVSAFLMSPVTVLYWDEVSFLTRYL